MNNLCPDNKLKVFVSAYACEPGLGSEIGVGWHWVIEMAKYFELWVMTRESNRQRIETWMKEHPQDNNIHFLYYDLPKWARFWKKGLRGVRTYYNIWQIMTNKIVERTMKQENIQVFHHLTYGNAIWRVSKYGQQQCFIWGPIGGLESIPKDFTKHYSWKWKLIEAIRRMMANTAKWNIGLRKKVQNADLILCKTKETLKIISLFSNKNKILFTDVAPEYKKNYTFAISPSHHTRFISVGRLDAWRGFDLVIEAFEKVHEQNENTTLCILGEGSERNQLEKIIAQKKLCDCVTLKGEVTIDIYQQLMEESDVVVNASLKEGSVTVAFDAMAMGKPIVCIDTGGYTRYFDDSFAVVIELTNRREVIDKLKTGMLMLTKTELRKDFGENAMSVAKQLSWEKHGADIRDVITKAYEDWNDRTKVKP